MALAVRVAGRRYLSADRVDVTVLATPAAGAASPKPAPTKENIRKAFTRLADLAQQGKVGGDDVLVVYLAGHGTGVKVNNFDTYCFLTADARSLNLVDPALRNQGAITHDELHAWMQGIPCRRKIVILDTAPRARRN